MPTASQGGKKRGSDRCDIAVLPVVCETDRETEILTETEIEIEIEIEIETEAWSSEGKGGGQRECESACVCINVCARLRFLRRTEPQKPRPQTRPTSKDRASMLF